MPNALAPLLGQALASPFHGAQRGSAPIGDLPSGQAESSHPPRYVPLR
jgi:hypothetical protein